MLVIYITKQIRNENTNLSLFCLALQFCKALKQGCKNSKSPLFYKFETDTCLLISWKSSKFIVSIVDISKC